MNNEQIKQRLNKAKVCIQYRRDQFHLASIGEITRDEARTRVEQKENALFPTDEDFTAYTYIQEFGVENGWID